jgi:hypothetical protein
MEARADVQQRYQDALEALAADLEQDYYVLAALVYGSVARGEAWERSDVDLEIVMRDGLERLAPFRWLDVDGINISANVVPRSQFKRAMDGALQGSIGHAIRSHAKLLFSKDESIAAWIGESSRIGARDQGFQLMRVAAEVIPTLDKAEKWFYVKDDMHYSFVWIMYVVNQLARVEVVLNGEAPGREVIHQALKYNPAFFHAVYTDLIDGPKDREALQSALDMINAYLEERAETLFGPVLDYLAQAEGMRTASELDAHFRKKVQSCGLARKEIVEKVASPVRLTRKSQVTLEEPAYFYDGDPSEWE